MRGLGKLTFFVGLVSLITGNYEYRTYPSGIVRFTRKIAQAKAELIAHLPARRYCLPAASKTFSVLGFLIYGVLHSGLV